MIKECIEEEKTPKEIILELKDSVGKNNISEQDALIMVRKKLIFKATPAQAQLLQWLSKKLVIWSIYLIKLVFLTKVFDL